MADRDRNNGDGNGSIACPDSLSHCVRGLMDYSLAQIEQMIDEADEQGWENFKLIEGMGLFNVC